MDVFKDYTLKGREATIVTYTGKSALVSVTGHDNQPDRGGDYAYSSVSRVGGGSGGGRGSGRVWGQQWVQGSGVPGGHGSGPAGLGPMPSDQMVSVPLI